MVFNGADHEYKVNFSYKAHETHNGHGLEMVNFKIYCGA